MGFSAFKAVASALLLAGCVDALDVGRSRAHPVMGGTVNVGLPEGYCVDRSASQDLPEGSIVLMGRCDGEQTVPPAIITASVGQAGSAGVMAIGGPEMAAFFRSPQGLATLSANSRASDVQLRQALGHKGAFLMQLNDRDKGDYWRAVVGVRGRLVTLSVTGVDAQSLSAAQSRALLDQTLAAMQRANKG